jgi:WD repeat-containing protein 49
MTSKLELSLAYRIIDIDATPFCLDYWSDPENPNDAILCWGDVKGNVHAILFNSAIIALFERPAQQTNDTGKRAFFLCLWVHVSL